MKLQHLAVIFILIIMPISMVISTYVNNLIDVSNKEAQYDTVLMNSTYDAVRAYQINTLHNSFASVNSSKVRDINASVNSFFNSLATGLSSKGYSKNDLEHYVPSILITLYDGFYTYGPYENYVDINEGEVKYNTKKTSEYGLKPYKFYTCEYEGKDENGGKNYHIFINYTLDNYINIYGTYGGEYITKSGYYIDSDKVKNIDDNTKTVSLDGGITIGPETLGEYIYSYNSIKGSKNTTINLEGKRKYYRYINYNEEKYYYDDSMDSDDQKDISLSYLRDGNGHEITDASGNPTTPIPIFYLDNNLKIYISDNMLRKLADHRGCSAEELCRGDHFEDVNNYYYYKNAKEFSDDVYKYIRGIDLYKSVIKSDTYNNTGKHMINTESSDGTPTNSYHMKFQYTKDTGKIFDYKMTENVNGNSVRTNDPEAESSYFNQHRIDVIISNVESELASAIANFNNYQYNSSYDFRMPTVSENDWYKVANNVNIMAFMQGFAVGNYKFYNNYALVSDTKNKEFISKENIFVQKNLVGDPPYDGDKQEPLNNLYKNNNNEEYYHDPRCAEFHNNASGSIIAYRAIDYEVDSFVHDYSIDLGGGNIQPGQVNVNYYMQPGTGGYECTVSVNEPMFSYDDLIRGTTEKVTLNDEPKTQVEINKNVRTAYLSALAREKGAAFKNLQLLNIDTDNINNHKTPIPKVP